MAVEVNLEKLVLRCRQGDTEAFEELFEVFQPRLKYYIRRLTNCGNADDLLQDVWLTVIRNLRNLKDARSFDVWLYRIARNKVIDEFRRRDIFAPLPEEHQLPSTEDDELTFDPDEAEMLHIALDKLSPPHKEVLTLFFIEQMSYQAIADVIDCGIGTVRSRLYYAKQSLRKEMEKQNG